MRLIHIGDDPPDVLAGSMAGTLAPVELIDGQVVETILRLAQDQGMDIIVMPTASHQGFLDLRVLRHAACPVLAVRAF
jgi:nucleotide-binding universal stress UspA family protein